MKHKLWSIYQVQIPHSNNTRRFVNRRRVLIIRRDTQFWELEKVSYEHSTFEGNTFGDQSTSVIDRFRHNFSDQKVQTDFTLLPSESSL
jgi:hypothetical protein